MGCSASLEEKPAQPDDNSGFADIDELFNPVDTNTDRSRTTDQQWRLIRSFQRSTITAAAVSAIDTNQRRQVLCVAPSECVELTSSRRMLSSPPTPREVPGSASTKGQLLEQGRCEVDAGVSLGDAPSPQQLYIYSVPQSNLTGPSSCGHRRSVSMHAVNFGASRATLQLMNSSYASSTFDRSGGCLGTISAAATVELLHGTEIRDSVGSDLSLGIVGHAPGEKLGMPHLLAIRQGVSEELPFSL